MVKCIYVNSDGTIDSYDNDDCKLPHLCGDYTMLHTVIELASNKKPSELPSECQMVKTEFYFRLSNTNESLPISLGHLKKITSFIIQDVNKSTISKTKQSTVSRFKGNETRVEFIDE